MKYFVVLIFSIVLSGCGSDSSNTDQNMIPTTQSLVGSYTLKAISGTAWVQNKLITLTEQDVSVTGSLDIDEQNFVYELTIDIQGQPSTTETFTKIGQYLINFLNSPTDGSIKLITPSEIEMRNFSLIDKEMFFDINAFLGSGTYQGQETWLKESDIPNF